MSPAMRAWMALLASAADPYFVRLVGGSVLMIVIVIVIVKFGKSARTVDLRNFQKKCFFFKKKVFCFLKENIFFGEWNKGGPGAQDPQKDRGVAQMNGIVTTVEEADAVRFVKHEAEKRAQAAQAAQTAQATQTAQAAQAPRNLMAAFNAA